MQLIPFWKDADDEFDTIYKFRYKPDTVSKQDIPYLTEITIDELNDSLLVKKECTCDGFKYGKICKHIRGAIRLLIKFGVEFREK